MSVRLFDQIRIFAGFAERTGEQLTRNDVRGVPTVCRSIRDLRLKYRRLGDGEFYMPASNWPRGSPVLDVRCDLGITIGEAKRRQALTHRPRA